VFFDDNNYLWLLKPIDFNRGNGIHVFSKLEVLEQLLTQYYNGFFQQQLKDDEKEKTSDNEGS
jgi:tubulin monoglycylase TTLL3/8